LHPTYNGNARIWSDPGVFLGGKPLDEEAGDMKLQFARKGSIVVVLTILVGLLAAPTSIAAEGSLLQRVEDVGAVPISDDECASIAGQGVLSGLVAGLAGSVAAGLAYLIDCAVDAVLDRVMGDDGDDTHYSPRALYETMGTGFIGGFFGGLWAPSV
jgi:hypothetical protein